MVFVCGQAETIRAVRRVLALVPRLLMHLLGYDRYRDPYRYRVAK